MTSVTVKQARPSMWILSLSFFFVTGGMAGCSFAGDQILPAHLAQRISSHGTADDHLAAAQLYQRHAQELEADAAAYARQGEAITPLEDTKGFRRSALKTAAQERQRQADDLLQLVAEHQRRAQTMTVTQSQQ